MQNNPNQKPWAAQERTKVSLRDIQAEQSASSNSNSWVEQVKGGVNSEDFKRPEVHVYIAGQDVFYQDAIKIGNDNKKLLETLGMVGHFPFDNEIPKEAFNDPRVASRLIFEANMKMIIDCEKNGNVAVIIANMNPFHGPSMDTGTAFEMGAFEVMKRMNPGRVIILGYSASTEKFEDRVINQIYGGNANTYTDEKGVMRAKSDNNMIEAFGGVDNLMMDSAATANGAKICKTFEEAAMQAKELSDKLIKDLEEKRANKVARQERSWAMS